MKVRVVRGTQRGSHAGAWLTEGGAERHRRWLDNNDRSHRTRYVDTTIRAVIWSVVRELVRVVFRR